MKNRQCALDHPSFRRLLYAYEHRNELLKNEERTGKKVVGKLGYGVCDELILAAGMESMAISPNGSFRRETADTYLEYSFTEKGKRLFARLAEGRSDLLPDYAAIADSEDVMNRIYYYLRELKREEPERKIPELFLVDWLFSRHMIYRSWNVKALQRFCDVLETWSGNQITENALKEAIALSNSQYAAAKQITALRSCEVPRVTGCEALVMFGAKEYMDKREYTDCLSELAEAATLWPEAEGEKLYFSGSAQYDTGVYEAIEARGFVICGEDHDWGSRMFERSIRTDLAPLEALADSYMLRSPSAQKGLVHERVDSLLAGLDASGAGAVIFWTDEYDEAGSWDYPSQKRALDEKEIPSVCFCKMKWPTVFEEQVCTALDGLKRRIGG